MTQVQREILLVAIRAENNAITCNPIGLQVLQGNRVRLIRTAPEYTDFIYACYQNDNFMDLYRLAQNRKITKKEIKEQLTAEQANLPQELKRIEWIILKHENQQQTPIGIAALADYQTSHRRAEFLMGIPDERYRKKLLSLEASLLVLDFAFNQVGLHKVISFVYGYNNNAQKNTLHLGFKQEGFLKEHIQSKRGFIDLFQNGMLRTDFLNNTLLTRLSLRLLNQDITKPKQVTISNVSTELIEKFNKRIRKGLNS